MRCLAQRLDVDGRRRLSDTIGWWICLALAALSVWGASTSSAHANPVVDVKAMALDLAPHRPLIWTPATAGLLVAAPWKVAPGGPAITGSIPIATASLALRRKTDPAFAGSQAWGPVDICHPDRTDCTPALTPAWQSLLVSIGDLDRSRLATRIDRAVNVRIRYRSDRAMHGTGDQWSGPLDTMRRSEGDCEDLAILKMWLLARAGVPLADMYVLVVTSPHLDTAHAVLLVATGEDFLVLDNLSDEPRLARDAIDYAPLFSVNTFGIWLHVPAATRLAHMR
jgi:predicted transglutaminase-like cysteine proteinase